MVSWSLSLITILVRGMRSAPGVTITSVLLSESSLGSIGQTMQQGYHHVDSDD